MDEPSQSLSSATRRRKFASLVCCIDRLNPPCIAAGGEWRYERFVRAPESLVKPGRAAVRPSSMAIHCSVSGFVRAAARIEPRGVSTRLLAAVETVMSEVNSDELGGWAATKPIRVAFLVEECAHSALVLDGIFADCHSR